MEGRLWPHRRIMLVSCNTLFNDSLACFVVGSRTWFIFRNGQNSRNVCSDGILVFQFSSLLDVAFFARIPLETMKHVLDVVDCGADHTVHCASKMSEVVRSCTRQRKGSFQNGGSPVSFFRSSVLFL